MGLIAETQALEARSNLLLSPCRNRVTEARALPAALMGLPSLPAKFGFVVDIGLLGHLAGISGDLRVEDTAGALIVRADGATCRLAVANAVQAGPGWGAHAIGACFGLFPAAALHQIAKATSLPYA